MPDLTPDIDKDEPLEPPKRESVKILDEISTEDSSENERSAAERVFTTGTYRIHLSKEQSQVLGRKLVSLVDDILQTRKDHDWDSNWDLWEDLYFQVLQDRQFGQANVSVPIAPEVVDTVLSVLEQAVYTSKPLINIEPREPMDVDSVKRREQHLDYALNVEMKLKDRMDPANWELATLGTGVIHLPWLRETDRIRDEEEYDGTSTEDMERFDERYPEAEKSFPEIVSKLKQGKKVRFAVEYTEAIYDAPDPTHVPIRDWIVRDTAKTHLLHREVIVGHRFNLRWDDLVRLEEEGYYENVNDVRFAIDPITQERNEVPDFETKDYTIVSGVIRWRMEGETRERRYLVDFDFDSGTILRLLRYPYWHNKVNYIPFYFDRSSRYIYGRSLIQKIEGPQQEANSIHTLLIDVISFSLPMFKARAGTEMNFNPLRDGMFPGKVWYFSNPQSDAEAFNVSTPSGVNVLLALEQQAMRHAELSSGATQNLSGLESARDPDAPATKALAQTQQSLMRIGRYLSAYNSSLSELAFQVSELYYQFSPKGRIFRVLGENGSPAFPRITRQELRLRADYFPHGSTAALNPEKEKRENAEALELMLKEPLIAKSPLKRVAAWEILFDSFGSSWSQKKQKILPSAEEMELLRLQEQIALKAEKMKLKQGIVSMSSPNINRINGGQDAGTNGATAFPQAAPPAG